MLYNFIIKKLYNVLEEITKIFNMSNMSNIFKLVKTFFLTIFSYDYWVGQNISVFKSIKNDLKKFWDVLSYLYKITIKHFVDNILDKHLLFSSSKDVYDAIYNIFNMVDISAISNLLINILYNIELKFSNGLYLFVIFDIIKFLFIFVVGGIVFFILLFVAILIFLIFLSFLLPIVLFLFLIISLVFLIVVVLFLFFVLFYVLLYSLFFIKNVILIVFNLSKPHFKFLWFLIKELFFILLKIVIIIGLIVVLQFIVFKISGWQFPYYYNLISIAHTKSFWDNPMLFIFDLEHLNILFFVCCYVIFDYFILNLMIKNDNKKN